MGLRGPQWNLGLMCLATMLQHDLCDFDVMAEAENIYRKFHSMKC